MGGFAARFGYDDEGARVSDTYYPDPVAGIHGAVAALAGVGERARRGLLERLEHPVTGRRDYLASPVRLDGHTLATGRAAPLFGQHTDEVLAEWCGLSPDAIGELRDASAVGTMPRTQPRSRA